MPTPMHVPCTNASPASRNPSLALSFLGMGHPNFEPYWGERRGLLLLANGPEPSPALVTAGGRGHVLTCPGQMFLHVFGVKHEI